MRINSSPSGKGGGILKGVANFLYTLKGQFSIALCWKGEDNVDGCVSAVNMLTRKKKDGDVEEGARLTG